MRALLIALAASSLAGAAMADAPISRIHPNRTLGPDPTAACAKLTTQTVAPDGVKFFRRLDQLPWGVLEHAVLRTVAGCPVREIVYEGQTWYVASGSPQIERLDPAARAPIHRDDHPDGH
jgi:hypothetical protein